MWDVDPGHAADTKQHRNVSQRLVRVQLCFYSPQGWKSGRRLNSCSDPPDASNAQAGRGTPSPRTLVPKVFQAGYLGLDLRVRGPDLELRRCQGLPCRRYTGQDTRRTRARSEGPPPYLGTQSLQNGELRSGLWLSLCFCVALSALVFTLHVILGLRFHPQRAKNARSGTPVRFTPGCYASRLQRES